MEGYSLRSVKRLWGDQAGQTVVEYILLVAVMASLITATLSYIKNKYLGDSTKCDQAKYKSTLLCKISAIITPAETGKRFQYYPFKK